MNADRFCEGISKIGYRPAPAIMDIVDNSIAAGATNVLIELVLRAGAQATAAGSIEAIRILDNGSGMSAAEIEHALEIGAEANYEADSLSKFGMGLKSAGFSLGRRISVASKTDGGELATRFVDRDVIRERNQYGVCVADTNTEPSWLSVFQHGTLVEITKTPPRQDSASRCAKELRNKLGVIYKFFLASAEHPLSIALQVGRKEPEEIEARDMLHLDDAVLNYNPDDYDPSRPCLVYDDVIASDLLGGQQDIGLKISLFPRDQMKGYSGFTEDQKRRVSAFEIKRENSGFYFYRNGRLIRWGDKLEISSRDDINFRGEILFGTAQDDYFHVDVSKQNLELNEDFLDKLEFLCRIPLKSARDIIKRCTDMLNQGTGTEGEAFNERTEVFAEEDPSEIIEPNEPSVASTRRRLREQITKVNEEISIDDSVAEVTPEPVGAFQRIRYTDKMMSLDLAAPGFDAENGTYVRINRNHPFYQLVLNHFEPQSAERLALEALLFSNAVAESKTFENVRLDPAQINIVLNHLRSVFSQVANSWALSNQDIF